MERDSALFYTCSLIEYIGRRQRLSRGAVVEALGADVKRIYDYADVFHCEPIEKVADDFVERNAITTGGFDNAGACKYHVPDYWTVGEIYARLIEDVSEGDKIETLEEVYASWISDAISDYNTDFYYQPRDYIRECYRENRVLA